MIKVFLSKSYIVFCICQAKSSCIHSNQHVQRCSLCCQTSAVSEHFPCAKCFSPILCAQVTKCSSSNSHFACLCGKPDKQAVLDSAGAHLFLHQHLLVEEYSQEAPIWSGRCLQEGDPVQGHSSGPLCDSNREPGRVLWHAHQDFPRGTAMDSPRVI